MAEDKEFSFSISRTPSVKDLSMTKPVKVPKMVQPGRSRKGFITSATPRSSNLSISTPRSSNNRSEIVTPMTTNSDALYSACLIEYRNRLQVGVAVMNQKKPELFIYQYNDNRTYDSTLSILNFYDPRVILMSETSQGTPLSTIIQREFQLSNIETVQRKYFNETVGAACLEIKGSRSGGQAFHVDSSMFLALAAVACLVKYLEGREGIVYVPGSLMVKEMTLEGYVSLDVQTTKNLNLIKERGRTQKDMTLFNVLNFCKTPMGTRMLRANLAQPPNDPVIINGRLDVVQALLESDMQCLQEITASLQNFPDVDAINLSLASSSKAKSENVMQAEIANVLRLKHTLETLPTLTNALKKIDTELLSGFCQLYEDPKRQAILDKIHKTIDQDVSLGVKPSLQQLQTNLAFSIRPGINGLLDVARATFCETIEELQEEFQSLTEKFPNAGLRLGFSSSRGYHLSIVTLNPVPDIFVQLSKSGKRYLCSTDLLISMEERRKEAYSEIVHLTDQIIQELFVTVREDSSWMFRISESIATVDLLQSFATYVSLSDICVRPMIHESGPIAIKNGRHPVLEKSVLAAFVPNDVFLTESHNIQIVTGPNGAGKSTYLEQVALICIIGHLGCYVPASYARLRKLDSIMTKLSSCNEIGSKMGDFYKEAEEMAFILRNASRQSLVLIDEFGRGTSTVEGASLSWAVCENLLLSSPFTLFSTHFCELLALCRLYPNRIKHLFFAVNGQESTEVSHRIMEEQVIEALPEHPFHYGINVARLAKFPENIVNLAEVLSKDLEERLKIEDFHNQAADLSLLLQKLDVLRTNPDATDEFKKAYLKELQLMARRMTGS